MEITKWTVRERVHLGEIVRNRDGVLVRMPTFCCRTEEQEWSAQAPTPSHQTGEQKWWTQAPMPSRQMEEQDGRAQVPALAHLPETLVRNRDGVLLCPHLATGVVGSSAHAQPPDGRVAHLLETRSAQAFLPLQLMETFRVPRLWDWWNDDQNLYWDQLNH